MFKMFILGIFSLMIFSCSSETGEPTSDVKIPVKSLSIKQLGQKILDLGDKNSLIVLENDRAQMKVLNNGRDALSASLKFEDNKNIKLGKAGRKRYLGFRPKVRGVVMNPVDHPHGGGEGKSAGGRHPVSPKGQSAKGLKTRDNKRTEKFIVRRRKKKRA